jgi:hypothetical protein
MTLPELAEPLFQYICRLSRSARKGGNFDLGQVGADVRALLAEARGKAVGANLAEQWERIELVLVFFADSMIRESGLPWARDWKDIGVERGQMGGESRFFEMLRRRCTTRRRRRTTGWRCSTPAWGWGSRGRTRGSRSTCGGR